MKIQRLLMPAQEREILKICDDLNTYWRTVDNFEIALERYLEDLAFKYKLGLTSSEIHDIVNQILLKLLGDFDVSYSNAIYVIAQFIIVFIFNGSSPRPVVNVSEKLIQKAYGIETYLIQPETKLGGLKVVLAV